MIQTYTSATQIKQTNTIDISAINKQHKMLINLNNVTILNTQMAFQLFFLWFNNLSKPYCWVYHPFVLQLGGSFRVINPSLD